MQNLLTLPSSHVALDTIGPDELNAVLAANPARRSAFETQYRESLHELHPSRRSHLSLEVGKLSLTARILYLSVLTSTGNRRFFDQLDLDRSDLDRGRYVYTATGEAIDQVTWAKSLPTIDALLGARHRLVAMDGVSVALERLPEIPTAFTMSEAMARPHSLFLGRDLTTGEDAYLPIAQLTHTLCVGATGLGKSNLLRQVVTQLLASPGSVETIYMIDLKYGLEFAQYATPGAPILLATSTDELLAMLDEIQSVFEQRVQLLRNARKAQWEGPPILVIVDEFAHVTLAADSKETKAKLIDGFVRLGNQARAAGIYLWLQVQHAVAETVPTPLRRNLTTTIGFRQQSGQAAATLFGDTADFPVEISRLKPGQFLIRDGQTAEMRALQAAHIPNAK